MGVPFGMPVAPAGPGPWGAPAGPAFPAWTPPAAGPGAPAAAAGLPAPPPAAFLQALAPWVQLAGQLLQSSAVRTSLGPALDSLQSRPDLAQLVLGVATGVLTSAECQSALRDLVTGALDSSRFGELFSSRLRTLLEMHGLVARQPR
ncbi:hypothetical protein caldi_09860 [Caldinitratiruptor microaerophilus]|uniref:Uncharacterized protein n=2 Tax=Caldinitratiruptor microaerophilus TaxID=671077 RepID=A0AA35G5Q3_9FIRM|nr:hypothetical protein caldi_09860 [Caldinitratiruptor microaerophilus]